MQREIERDVRKIDEGCEVSERGAQASECNQQYYSSVLQCDAVCCSVLQCVAAIYVSCSLLQSVSVLCSVVQCEELRVAHARVAAGTHAVGAASVLQWVTVGCKVSHSFWTVLKCAAVCCSVLQCNAVFYAMLQC